MIFIIIAIALSSITISINAHPLLTCYDSNKYYTTATILNHSIHYTINGTRTIEYNQSPAYQTYLTLANNPSNQNISFHGILILEYHILTPCHYICNMEITANEKNAKFISQHFDAYFRIGGMIHMMCDSAGCNVGNLTCNTIDTHDEL